MKLILKLLLFVPAIIILIPLDIIMGLFHKSNDLYLKYFESYKDKKPEIIDIPISDDEDLGGVYGVIHFKKELAVNVPTDLQVDYRFLLKNVKDLYTIFNIYYFYEI